MFNFVATCSNIPVIGPVIDFIAYIFGYLMAGLYWVFDSIGIANIGLCIIFFTIIIRFAMAPLTFKQQKFSKISAAINPEIQAIQKKYKGKKDNESVAKMQAETKEVYSKYGTSQTGGCLQLVIQMPIFFALYQVIRSIPTYVPNVYSLYEKIANNLSSNYVTDVLGASGTGTDLTDNIVEKLAAFTANSWQTLIDAAGNSGAAAIIQENYIKIDKINSFLGMNLGESPWSMITSGIVWAALIPLVAGGAQFISTKLTPMNQASPMGSENSMASSMRTMNYIMPLMSVFFCLTLPAGLGLYWTFSSITQVVTQMIFNRHFNNEGIDVLIEKSVARANKKKAKKGIPAKTVTSAATKSTKSINSSNTNNTKKDTNTNPVKGTAKPGSLAAKAGRTAQTNNKKK